MKIMRRLKEEEGDTTSNKDGKGTIKKDCQPVEERMWEWRILESDRRRISTLEDEEKRRQLLRV